MSSHREAPEISKDPVADNTDTYAFVSPDNPGTVTIITNYIPLENPAGGPNFFEFGDDVLYSIYIDNDGDARPNITYQFRFSSQLRNPNTFLYNTGPINSLDDPNWNKRQFYDVTKVVASTIRPYPKLIAAAWPRRRATSARGRELRNARAGGGTRIADGETVLQVPIKNLTSDGTVPTDATSSKSVLGSGAPRAARRFRSSTASTTAGGASARGLRCRGSGIRCSTR